MPHISFATPLGDLSLFEEKGALVAVEWGRAAMDKERGGKSTPLLDRARKQLDEYFDGKRTKFDLPLAPSGTAFQKKVWAAIARIPYGQTASYGDVAHQVDSGPRAVGGACGKNPIGVIVPCHRVLGSQGTIGGYSGGGGLVTKKQLLKLEGVG
jgi:methylated-DNA-[protein]-cysteine S-methyltransferase